MQAACMPFGDEGIYVKSLKMHLNIYTAPGYLGIIMALLNLAAVIFFFRERKVYGGKEGIYCLGIGLFFSSCKVVCTPKNVDMDHTP